MKREADREQIAQPASAEKKTQKANGAEKTKTGVN